MLFQCWPSVFDAGPSLKQNCVNASCVCWECTCRSHQGARTTRLARGGPQSCHNVGTTSATLFRHCASVGSVSVLSWFQADPVPSRASCPIVYLTPANTMRSPIFVQCWASGVDYGPTLYQHWVNISCLLGRQLSERGLLCMLWTDRSAILRGC